MALLQNKLSSVEEELNEARGTVEEERGREGEWREGREFLQTDLKTAEKRLEDAYAEIEKEKALRYATNFHAHTIRYSFTTNNDLLFSSC